MGSSRLHNLWISTFVVYIISINTQNSTMKVVLALALLVACVCSAPTDSVESVDSFLSLVKEIEGSDFFPQLDLNNRLLTFEMLTAAETRNLKLLFDRLGYIVLLEYIDALPKDYQHRFVRYSIVHLLSEYPPATDATSN